MKKAIEKTFRELAAFDSPSGRETEVANYLVERLTAMGLEVKIDDFGNVIGFLAGEGEPILLNAHMDGVPPKKDEEKAEVVFSKGHVPIKNGDVLTSDGSTNLRADDIAGMAVILEATNSLVKDKKSHPPLVLAFTAQEEIGLWGAKALDLSEYGVTQGIVYDNAFDAGALVSRGAAYVGFDVEIKGRETHPGKDLAAGVNVVNVLLNTKIDLGEVDGGKSRVNIGTVEAGVARNVVPGKASISGEVRSHLEAEKLAERIKKIETAFSKAAEGTGAEVTFSQKQMAVAYEVNADEPLVQRYKQVVEARGGQFRMAETFVASDANALRGEKGLKVFVVSTGVVNEHSVEETVDLAELEQLAIDLTTLLSS